jgi:tyrosinase
MHAHTTLALSLSATLAYALPAHNYNHTTIVNTTTTISEYVLPQQTEVAQAPKQQHIADLRSKISYLKQQLSSQRGSSATLCYSPAETTAAPGGHEGNNGGAHGNPSATHMAANWSYFKSAHMSRLPATSTLSYPAATECTSTLGGSHASGVDGSSSAQVTEAPFPYTSHDNGTAGHYATGGTGTTTSLPPTYIPKLEDYSISEIDSGAALVDVNNVAIQRLQERYDLNGSCTFETARVRTEFRKMSNDDRKSFTDAIMCLKEVPTTVDASEYPGVKSRYDEYVATHINMTMGIHVTADFLAWHRNYIWEFENDLINTCGYTGSLPYWDWARDAYAPHESEVFNGDEFSLGSDGVYVADRDDTYLGLMDVTFPPGTGGGCVHSGPFSGGPFSNLGPLDSPYGDNVENSYDFNPRCLVRDLNSFFSSRYNTYANVTSLLLGQTDIQYFQAEMQGFVGDNKLGIHGAGHWLGGGPSQMQDFHSSPNDPIFFLHHAMIDRVWAIWQALDPDTRQDAIYGTSTLNNSPPSAEKQLTDSIAFGFAGQNEIFGDLMDTLGGKFCYRYE